MCDETSNQGSCIAACTMFPLPLVTNYSLKWLNSRLYTWHTRRELYGLGQTARAARRRYMNSYITVALWSCRARLLCASRGGSVSRAGNRRGHSNDSSRESQKAGQPEYWPSSRSRQSSANRNKNFSVRQRDLFLRLARGSAKTCCQLQQHERSASSAYKWRRPLYFSSVHLHPRLIPGPLS